MKRALIRKIAEVTRILHENGINHRDYYLCHFLLDVSAGKDNFDLNHLQPYLIDLHRVQFRKKLPARWRIKDLAALYFSALDIGLTQRDLLRFIRDYTQKPLRQSLHSVRWNKIAAKAAKLQQRFYRKYV